MFLLLFMGLVPHICGVEVHDVSTMIPTYAVNNNNLKSTLYSDENLIKCFEMEKEESFNLGPNEPIPIHNKCVAILYTSRRTPNVALAALYPDSCYYSLGKEINAKDDEFEVHLHGKGWAYFKDSICEEKNLESNSLPDTSWSLLIPQDPNEYPYDPHFDKSKVLDVLVDFQQHSYGLLENIKITVHTETEFVLKCYELNDGERDKLDSNAKYVSILFNDIEGTNRVALLIMTTCDNMDKNIINVKDEMMEVWLSNDKWAYFENGKCKGKEFVNSQLPTTVWILQDPNEEEIIKKMSQGLGQVLTAIASLPPKIAEMKKQVKITAYYKEFVLNYYELDKEAKYKFQNQPDVSSKYIALIKNTNENSKVKYLLAFLILKSCDNMDRNIINIDVDGCGYEVSPGQSKRLMHVSHNVLKTFTDTMSYPYCKWTLQKP